MKQPINEELNYMKYLLLYKKGIVISEQDSVTPQYTLTNTQGTVDNTNQEYMCPASGSTLIDKTDNEIKSIVGENVKSYYDEVSKLKSIPNGSDQDGDYKTQTITLMDMISKIPSDSLAKANIETLKLAIKEVLSMVKNQGNPQEQNNLSEQDGLDLKTPGILERSFPELYPFLQKIKPWMWITMGAYFVCVFLRCLIYKVEAMLMKGCSLKWKSSFLASLTYILLLDFKNFKNRKNNRLYGCNWMFRRI
jgi:hypothetical protein